MSECTCLRADTQKNKHFKSVSIWFGSQSLPIRTWEMLYENSIISAPCSLCLIHRLIFPKILGKSESKPHLCPCWHSDVSGHGYGIDGFNLFLQILFGVFVNSHTMLHERDKLLTKHELYESFLQHGRGLGL